MMKEPMTSTFAHPAVTATRPARDPFKDMETSGLPFLIHVKIIALTVATAGATVVVAKICDNCIVSVAAAPLNPYQPNQRMNTPRAPIKILCPRIGLAFPFLSYLPIRGPSIAAPMKAVIPPTIWMHADPAKSVNPISVSHGVAPQTQ